MNLPKENGPLSRFIDHTSYASSSDEEIVQRVLQGEPELYEVLVRRHNQKLYRIIRSYLSTEPAVLDAMQTAWIRAYEKLDRFRGDARFSTWLVRIAINESLMQLRRKRTDNTISVTDLPSVNQTVLVDNEDPSMKSERKELKKFLEEAVNALPPKYRTVFVMREVEGMNTAEVAACLELTESNVKVRLHRSREMLQHRLREQCGDLYPFLGARCDRMVQTVMGRISR